MKSFVLRKKTKAKGEAFSGAKRFVLILALAVIISNIFICPKTFADDEEAYFGSDAYSWIYEEDSQIGVYVSSSGTIASASITVTYETDMLEYVSGGSSENDGTITINASDISDSEYGRLLTFTPVSGGTALITIESAEITLTDGTTYTADPVTMKITISMPEDTALSSLTIGGSTVTGFDPTITVYSFSVDYSIETLEIAASAESEDASVEIDDASLSVGKNAIGVYVTSSEGETTRYLIYAERYEEETEAQIIEEITETDAETYAEEADEESEGLAKKFYNFARNGYHLLKDIYAAHRLLCFVFVCIVLFAVFDLFILIVRAKRAKKRRLLAEQRRKRRQQLEADLKASRAAAEDEAEKTEEGPLDVDKAIEQAEEGLPPVVIDVSHVTMDFKRDKDESSSLKELIIRILKRQRQMITFRALDDISFTVREGEVVGIIGTNGSGKSTILKIISGSLAPSSGRVRVDKRKIQLLTLGTGFDHELTGRENVYLNGAIIGYSKEFIDEHYDSIVEFAELEGFMDEKVRNYSSGMVSRLGFAIATARDTPEILILDEVLSVGDMFFRKKSLARIKEMIHGGSTVLIVSHSTATIRENCSKVVWIEKSHLKMIGDPKVVCKAYENMNKKGE